MLSMDDFDLTTDSIDVDGLRERFNAATGTIWSIAEDLNIEADDINDAIAQIEAELNADF